jgi:hypothetical protein
MAGTNSNNEDRRSGQRYMACFPGLVVLPDGRKRVAVIRDLSETGVRLLTEIASVAIGDPMQLELHLEKDPESFCLAQGRVVRIEPVDEPGLWKHCVAVTFDWPLAMGADDIARFQELPPVFEVEPEE